MPRKPTTPQEAQAKALAHILKARKALATAEKIVRGTDPFTDEGRNTFLREAAKAIEAAGCYIRRAHADHLLIP